MADNASGQSGSSSSKPPTSSKAIKPRAGVQRRSQASREQYAKQEAEREQARVQSQGGARGGKSTTRGRASVTQSSRDDKGTGSRAAVAGGVFGAGSGLKPGAREKGMLGVSSGHSELLAGQGRSTTSTDGGLGAPAVQSKSTNTGDAGGHSNSRTTRQTGTKSSSANVGEDEIVEIREEEDVPSRNIDLIDITSGEDEAEDEPEDDIRSSKRKVVQRTPKRNHGLRPVRAPRTIKTEGEEEGETQEKKASKVTRKPSDDENIEIDNDVMEVDESSVTFKEAPLSPDLRKKLPVRRDSRRAKDSKTATGTIEEQAERRRLQDDMHKLRNEFLHDYPHAKRETTAFDRDASEDGGDKLFLFQFPPMIPFLIDPEQPSVQLKQEDTIPEVSEQDHPQDHPDEDSKEDVIPSLQHEGLLTATEPRPLPPGYVGKLRIHKSGKVSLDWAGTDMEVRYGAEVDFLQDAVLVEAAVPEETAKQKELGHENTSANDESHTNESGPAKVKERSKSIQGKSHALGQVRKKMVVVPDWGKLYD